MRERPSATRVERGRQFLAQVFDVFVGVRLRRHCGVQLVDVREQFLHAFADERHAVVQILDRRVDLVRHAGGEPADGFEPLARRHALFGGLAIGDVEPGADDAGELAVLRRAAAPSR